MVSADEIINFWFVEHDQNDWFGSAPEFDLQLRTRFFETHARVAAGEAFGWRDTPQGRLAEIVVLDQFSRQFFRREAKAFAYDGMALVLAQELVASGGDLELEPDHKTFAYMPYMHSESLKIHDEALRLFSELGNAGTLEFEMSHREVIEKFGRFPMRNKALGRSSSHEELEYIKSRDGNMF